MGFLSSRRDHMLVDGLGIDGAFFEAALLDAMAELEAAHPDRFRSLIAGDDSHTFVLRDFERVIGGRQVKGWIGDMLDGSDAWVSAAD